MLNSPCKNDMALWVGHTNKKAEIVASIYKPIKGTIFPQPFSTKLIRALNY